MKLCEFFKKQFDNAKETAKHFEADSKYLVEVSGYEKGSFEGFKELSKRYFGGGYFYHYEADGITSQQLKKRKNKVLLSIAIIAIGRHGNSIKQNIGA